MRPNGDGSIKLLVLMVMSVLGAAILMGATPGIQTADDGKGGKIPVQGIAPNYRKDVTLTGNSQVIDVSNDTAWKAYLTNDGKFRTMSSATKTGIAHVIPGTTWTGEVINHGVTKKTFLNLSGSVGTLRRQ